MTSPLYYYLLFVYNADPAESQRLITGHVTDVSQHIESTQGLWMGGGGVRLGKSFFGPKGNPSLFNFHCDRNVPKYMTHSEKLVFCIFPFDFLLRISKLFCLSSAPIG